MELYDKILVADDQHINIEVLQQHLTKLDVIKRCEFFYDGQLTIDRTKELIDDAISFTTYGLEDVKKLTPVSLILLDFQMPVKNGIDVVNELRRYYRVINETLEDTKPGF